MGLEVSKEAKFQERDLVAMRRWCEDNTWYNDSFLQSLEVWYCDHKYLTDRQYTALLNMMERAGVE